MLYRQNIASKQKGSGNLDLYVLTKCTSKERFFRVFRGEILGLFEALRFEPLTFWFLVNLADYPGSTEQSVPTMGWV